MHEGDRLRVDPLEVVDRQHQRSERAQRPVRGLEHRQRALPELGRPEDEGLCHRETALRGVLCPAGVSPKGANFLRVTDRACIAFIG